jgi:hypothetical protein
MEKHILGSSYIPLILYLENKAKTMGKDTQLTRL